MTSPQRKRTADLAPVAERAGVTPSQFREEILPQGEPVLMRGLVRDWPIVKAGLASPQDFCSYLRRFDRGASVTTMMGAPGIGGRFFYSDDLTGFNFRQETAKLASVLDFLLTYLDDPKPSAMAAQSVPVGENLPGLQIENRMPLLGPEVDPRIWIGNRAMVAAHHDPSENIACVVAGRRRFTLFPPSQVGNLYPGPFELTPAGASISMVDFEAPDFERHPAFAHALAAAQVAEMEPGDALYIPYHWWHHVSSLERFNALLNYWWSPPSAGRGAPRDALFHAMVAIRDLPPSHRAAWREMFEHYVFKTTGPEPGAHLPAPRRGIVGALDGDLARTIRAMLSKLLARG